MAKSPLDMDGLSLDDVKLLLLQALEEVSAVKRENAALREENARLKGLHGKPDIKPGLKLQRPAKTSRTSSKPPSTDRKKRRENSKPGGAKPGHKGEFRRLADNPDAMIDHRPEATGLNSGCPIGIRRNRTGPTVTRPVWRIWPATSPGSTRPAMR